MAEFLAIEMAELIERGLEITRKAPLPSDRAVFGASPLGLALIGRTGDPATALQRWREATSHNSGNRVEAAARLLRMPVALAALIELNHRLGLSASVITGKLRSGTLGVGYTTPVSPRKYYESRIGRAAPALP